MRAVGVLLALVLSSLLACGSGDDGVGTMIPAPVILRDPRLDFARFVAPHDRDTSVRVLYATTRAPAPAGSLEHYLRHKGDAVHLGLARVQLGEPGWSFDELVESDRVSHVDAPRPARVVSVDEFGTMGSGEADRALIAAIDRQVAASRTGEAVIYVPGYRVTFNHVMRLMGSWAHYLGGSSAALAFSWPSGTWVWSYLTDCPRARAFVPDIERLIALVGEASTAKRVNVIAFSCGSSLLAEALVRLRDRHPEEGHEALQRRYRIGNAIFVAADIDLETFARSHVPALADIAARTEVYLSEDDVALKFAALLAGASRLGRPRFQELTREDLETLATNERLVGIDVTGVYGAHQTTGMRGHGYWFANQRVSTDVLLSMIYPFNPAWRGLVHEPGRSMWTFPDDYPQRVGDAVYAAAPELRREPRQNSQNSMASDARRVMDDSARSHLEPVAAPAASGAAPSSPSAAIEGPVWRLTELRGQDPKALAALPQPATARFDSGRLQAFAGCNQLAGSYHLARDHVTVGPVAATMMACPEPLMAVEAAFRAALAGELRFRVDGDRLTLTAGADAAPRLVFERTPPPALEGIRWEVTGFNNGRQAVVSPLIGTTLTVSFQDGTIVGHAGCNTFRATYTRDGNRLSVGPAVATRRMCDGKGVMEQERQFLAAIESATTWAIERDMLDLHRPDGERVLLASPVAK